MKYKIVVDSCCDLTDEMKSWENLAVVPLTLQIGDYVIKDDEKFDQEDFIKKMKSDKNIAKSACPSPEAFAAACEGEEQDVYIITITDKLSGTYNSAVQGANIYRETHGENSKNIYVFNSLATSGLETLLAYSVKKLADTGIEFNEVVKKTEKEIVKNYGLYFCLESLDAMKNNGRLLSLGAKLIETVRLKLVLRRNDEGNISSAERDFVEKRALFKLVNCIANDVRGRDLSQKSVIISHVCCLEKAREIKKMLLEKTLYKNITILKASGLNSLYASNGGVIVSYSK